MHTDRAADPQTECATEAGATAAIDRHPANKRANKHQGSPQLLQVGVSAAYVSPGTVAVIVGEGA